MPFVTEDEKCMIDVYSKHKDLLKSGNFDFENKQYVVHPFLGWVPKPNFAKEWQDELLTDKGAIGVLVTDIKQNSQGLSSTKEYSKNKPNSTVRIAMLGDSYTQGADVSHPFSYPAILEQITENTEVLNFGVSGYGVDQMYLRFLNETLEFNNDAVIMGIYIDDIQRSAHTCKYYLKPKFEVKDGSLELTNTPVPPLREFMMGYKEPKLQSYFIKHLLNNIYNMNPKKRNYNEGFAIFMVLAITSETEPELNEKLRGYLRKQDIDFIDSMDVFSEAHAGAYKNYNFYISGHFNSLGGALIAQKIKNVLEEKKIIRKTPNYKFISNSYVLNEVLVLQNLENGNDLRYITNFMPINGSLEMPKGYVPFEIKA
ncbi:SGNH/GDSL hydrolase family protein [Candidatus Woesearchaeota archaeon]|nr:SGNH/GDSL hydrolase family protein [Candidatus Woesearchaeota archaeon]